jgi:hypothetical protein
MLISSNFVFPFVSSFRLPYFASPFLQHSNQDAFEAHDIDGTGIVPSGDVGELVNLIEKLFSRPDSVLAPGGLTRRPSPMEMFEMIDAADPVSTINSLAFAATSSHLMLLLHILFCGLFF